MCIEGVGLRVAKCFAGVGLWVANHILFAFWECHFCKSRGEGETAPRCAMPAEIAHKALPDSSKTALSCAQTAKPVQLLDAQPVEQNQPLNAQVARQTQPAQLSAIGGAGVVPNHYYTPPPVGCNEQMCLLSSTGEEPIYAVIADNTEWGSAGGLEEPVVGVYEEVSSTVVESVV